MTRVTVTDGDERSALAVVRSLGRAGHAVDVVSRTGRSLAGASRHARSDTAAPDPLGDRAAFRRAVRDLVADRSSAMLLPVTEASLHALLPHRDELGDVRIPCPGYEAFVRASDKARVLDVAAEVGVAVPGEVRLSAPVEEPRAVLGSRLKFPLVVKPSRSVVASGEGLHATGVFHAGNEAELVTSLGRLPATSFPVLVQERIRGHGTGVFLLRWGGELVAAFAHRRIREKPPSGGVSVLRQSVELDPNLLASSLRLLDLLGWEGVAMVEYRTEVDTGTPYLMEVNPRFWGSLQLAIDAGVDFPRLLLEALEGRRPEPVTSYEVGVRSRWLWGDVDHLVARLRHSREELSLPTDAPGRVGAVRDFLAGFGGASRSEVFRRDDAAPFLRETSAWLRALAPGSRRNARDGASRAPDAVSP